MSKGRPVTDPVTLAVGCPTCQQPPGRACRTASGPRPAHFMRIAAFNAAFGQQVQR